MRQDRMYRIVVTRVYRWGPRKWHATVRLFHHQKQFTSWSKERVKKKAKRQLRRWYFESEM